MLKLPFCLEKELYGPVPALAQKIKKGRVIKCGLFQSSRACRLRKALVLHQVFDINKMRFHIITCFHRDLLPFRNKHHRPNSRDQNKCNEREPLKQSALDKKMPGEKNSAGNYKKKKNILQLVPERRPCRVKADGEHSSVRSNQIGRAS